jgi:hypothetical protein
MPAHTSPKPLSGKLLFINTDNFSGPGCRNFKLSAANRGHYAKEGFSFFHSSNMFLQ